MPIFSSESELLELLEGLERQARAFAAGDIPYMMAFDEICRAFNCYALDGHESDEEELAILEKHSARIDRIERVAGCLSHERAPYGGVNRDEVVCRARKKISEILGEEPNQQPQQQRP